MQQINAMNTIKQRVYLYWPWSTSNSKVAHIRAWGIHITFQPYFLTCRECSKYSLTWFHSSRPSSPRPVKYMPPIHIPYGYDKRHGERFSHDSTIASTAPHVQSDNKQAVYFAFTGTTQAHHITPCMWEVSSWYGVFRDMPTVFHKPDQTPPHCQCTRTVSIGYCCLQCFHQHDQSTAHVCTLPPPPLLVMHIDSRFYADHTTSQILPQNRSGGQSLSGEQSRLGEQRRLGEQNRLGEQSRSGGSKLVLSTGFPGSVAGKTLRRPSQRAAHPAARSAGKGAHPTVDPEPAQGREQLTERPEPVEGEMYPTHRPWPAEGGGGTPLNGRDLLFSTEDPGSAAGGGGTPLQTQSLHGRWHIPMKARRLPRRGTPHGKPEGGGGHERALSIQTDAEPH